jgi:hypothetical protein
MNQRGIGPIRRDQVRRYDIDRGNNPVCSREQFKQRASFCQRSISTRGSYSAYQGLPRSVSEATFGPQSAFCTLQETNRRSRRSLWG